MAWPYGEDDDPQQRKRWRTSRYWSDVCKDLGKYVLTAGAAAPFFGIGGAALSWALLFGALVVGGGILYLGCKFAPDEPSEPN